MDAKRDADEEEAKLEANILFERAAQKERSNCIDKDEHCAEWAVTGECEKNPRFMWAKCKKSCGKCQQQAEEEAKRKVNEGAERGAEEEAERKTEEEQDKAAKAQIKVTEEEARQR